MTTGTLNPASSPHRKPYKILSGTLLGTWSEGWLVPKGSQRPTEELRASIVRTTIMVWARDHEHSCEGSFHGSPREVALCFLPAKGDSFEEVLPFGRLQTPKGRRQLLNPKP